MNSTQVRSAAPQLRASDADRDAVLALLSEHFQAGRLTAGEFDERSGQALGARTYGELGALTADLPAPVSRAAAPSPAAPQTARHGGLVVLGVIAIMLIAGAAFGLASGWRHGSGLWWLIPVALFAARRIALGGSSGPRRIRRY